MKCEYCEKEEPFPFRCSHCNKYFCSDHRLPESHVCSGVRFPQWKETYEQYEPPKQPEPVQEEHVYEPIRTIESKTPKARKNIKTILGGLLAGLAITLLGLGIILWEIYNPLFWTVILIWFIPVPLVLIGGFLLVFGILVAGSSVAIFVGSLPPIKKIVALLLIMLILSITLWNAPSIISTFQEITRAKSSAGQTPQTSFPTYQHEELVDHALSLINSDRSKHGVSNVSLSSIDSGQKHAENMLRYGFFSHWDTNGYKPYMRYTLTGGKGSVAENVAWDPSPIDAKESIKELERLMMYEDAEWDWGHRDNILNPFHNKVSIGIAYDHNNLYFVQDFENDYVQWSTFSVAQNGEAIMSGSFENQGFQAEWVNIFYDPLPTKLTSYQLERAPYNGSYTLGSFVGMVVPSGYESPEGITITATTWSQVGGAFQIRFNLSQAFDSHGKGVYTLYLQLDPKTSEEPLTNYSFWKD